MSVQVKFHTKKEDEIIHCVGQTRRLLSARPLITIQCCMASNKECLWNYASFQSHYSLISMMKPCTIHHMQVQQA